MAIHGFDVCLNHRINIKGENIRIISKFKEKFVETIFLHLWHYLANLLTKIPSATLESTRAFIKNPSQNHVRPYY